MSEATVRGIVHLVEDTKTYGKNGFRKRLVVLEQDKGRFTNYVPLDFVQDGCDAADQLNVGDEIEVRYRLSGRRWQRDANSEVKFFLNAEALDFKVVGGSGNAGKDRSAGTPAAAEHSDDEAPYEGDDEIPF